MGLKRQPQRAQPSSSATPELGSPSFSIMFALYVNISPKHFCALVNRGTPSYTWTHFSFLKLSPQPCVLLMRTYNSPSNNKVAAGKSYGLIKPRPSIFPLSTPRALIKPFHRSRATVSTPAAVNGFPN